MADHKPAIGLHRAELAHRTGCNLESIRYYEKIGMLQDPRRSGSGYRSYEDAHVQRLRFILRARELGFSIDDVRELLSLIDGGTQTCADVKHRTEKHLADVRTRIVDLQRIESVLSVTASQCSGKAVPQCPRLETLAR